jgi:antitoxin (DNA-binding transcriptional repressor) of toxin-antitoxin stability system
MDKPKAVTVRDLRTRFPEIERRLLNGEELAVTKHGQVIALLVQPSKHKPKRKLDFKKRFGGPVKYEGPATDVVGMLLRSMARRMTRPFLASPAMAEM